MWYLIQSNQLERLFERLAAVLAVPPRDSLAAEVIVVQNAGMARWLAHRIALVRGVSANIQFPLPGRFIWQVLASQMTLPGDQGDYDRQVLRWRIFQAFTEDGAGLRFPELAAYLRDDGDGRKTLQLADKVADLFDQYLVYRPDMLLAWESLAVGGWQAELWRKLAAGCGPHRARLLQLFRDRFRAGGIDAVGLPQRIFLFGMSSLAPVYLEILAAVSTVTDIHLFHLSPCRHYWGDLASSAEMARRRAGWRQHNRPDVSGYYDEGNPLLASLGKAGREFSHLLAGMEGKEEECYQEPAADTMLGLLQRDILELENHAAPEAGKVTVAAGDRSVQVHVCHSRLREVQVLHDSLLHLFAGDLGLTPRDILVMAPAIEAYGPAIQAVFDSAPEKKSIPWSLSDRMLRAEEPLAEAFLTLLDLPGSRCSAPAVLAFLEQDAVRRRYGFDEDGLATVRRWLREAGIRWALDRDQRRRHGLDMDDLHSWAFGMRRLLLGYFSGGEAPLFKGIAPCGPISAGDAVLLGQLAEFLDSLRQAGRILDAEHTPAGWAEKLLGLLALFFDPGDSEEAQQSLRFLREAICALADECRAGGVTGPISPAVLRSYFSQGLSVSAGGQAFLSGRVTFCNMVPMRSIPFAVICLLGMNDTDYPRHQDRVSFDMIAGDPRPGDRNRRDDDRYLFLESLLSARRVLYLSWVGRDQRDNSFRPPSVVVAELLDYLQRACISGKGSPVSLQVEHPLQPFSPRCYDGSTGLASFAAEWYPGGEEMGESVFVPGPLPEAEEEKGKVDLRQLKRFWVHPVRYFLQERLGLRLREEDDTLPESEPFHPDRLELYNLAGTVVRERLAHSDEVTIRARLQATGELPHGGFGDNAWRDLQRLTDTLVTPLEPLLSGPREAAEVELALGDFRLSGWLDCLHAAGCVRYRPVRTKGRDLLALWLDHLVMNCLKPADCDLRSYQVATDSITCFKPVNDPQGELLRLLALFRHGLREPLHFFPETALAWCEAKEEQRESKARAAWQGGFKQRGESDDPAYRLGLRGREPLNLWFRELAEAVYRPLLSARER
ncbi:MAG TPA: exodeoxyribonuclease V subunit gamma [Desulfobulbaceae bacterium]|nr:exodeoxyribonuclease V subunit gamma [Desulfobulbaceae bacterium]